MGCFKIHKHSIYYIALIPFIIFCSSLEAKRATVSDLYSNYEQGNVKFCRNHFDEVNKKNSNNSNMIYMKGLLEIDGEKSVANFKELSDRYKTSSKLNMALNKQSDYQRISGLINKKTAYQEIKEAKVSKMGDDKQEKPKDMMDNPNDNSDGIKIFYLQLGAFSSKANAQKVVNKLSGFDAFIKVNSKNGRILYLVFTGAYESQSEADKMADKIRKLYSIESIIKEF